MEPGKGKKALLCVLPVAYLSRWHQLTQSCGQQTKHMVCLFSPALLCLSVVCNDVLHLNRDMCRIVRNCIVAALVASVTHSNT